MLLPSHLSDQPHHLAQKGNSIETEFNISKNQLWVLPPVICELLCGFHLLCSYLTFSQPSTAFFFLLTCLHPFSTVMTASSAMLACLIVFSLPGLVSPRCFIYLFIMASYIFSAFILHLRYNLHFWFFLSSFLAGKAKFSGKSSHPVKRG